MLCTVTCGDAVEFDFIVLEEFDCDALAVSMDDIRFRVDDDALDDDTIVLLESENDTSAKAYCGKIMRAESKIGIKSFCLMLHHRT